jgi:cytochrome c oxidase subunit III
VLLLSSGFTITWSHHSLIKKKDYKFKFGLFLTIFLGVLFLFFQKFEYSKIQFSFNTLIYGSCFYMLTGFHGGHVIVGTIFLMVCLFRALDFHFSSFHHVGFELAI